MNNLLVFSASWCAPCSRMKPVLENLDQSRIIKYDVDSSDDELVQYGVRGVPTFVAVDAEGNEVGRIVGETTLEELEKLLA